MGSIGDCYDNGQMESFWARMQVELLNRKRWNTRLELANAIFEYLEISTTGNDVTHRSGCSARSSTSSATPTTWPAIKQADRAKPRAHESSHQTRGASKVRAPPIGTNRGPCAVVPEGDVPIRS